MSSKLQLDFDGSSTPQSGIATVQTGSTSTDHAVATVPSNAASSVSSANLYGNHDFYGVLEQHVNQTQVVFNGSVEDSLVSFADRQTEEAEKEIAGTTQPVTDLKTALVKVAATASFYGKSLLTSVGLTNDTSGDLTIFEN